MQKGNRRLHRRLKQIMGQCLQALKDQEVTEEDGKAA